MPGADTEGLIPRSIKKIVAVTRAAAAHNWNYTLEASFLEIYNEVCFLSACLVGTAQYCHTWRASLFCLVVGAVGGCGALDFAMRRDADQSLQDLLRDESSNHKATLSVHLDADGTVDVHNLTRVKVTDGDSIHELMAKAATMRSVGATSMNARSSRSHSVFTLRIRGARVCVCAGLHERHVCIQVSHSPCATEHGVLGMCCAVLCWRRHQQGAWSGGERHVESRGPGG